jgi:antitoxin ParD1/3/4
VTPIQRFHSSNTLIGKHCQSEYFLNQKEPGMPTRNVNLTPQLDKFVAAKIKDGRYENASEVIRAALRVLEREEKEYDVKLAALLKAIDEGDASGIAEGDVFERIRKSRNAKLRRRSKVA